MLQTEPTLVPPAPLDAQTVAAWGAVLATIAGVFAALFAVWWQIRKQWLLNSANIITELADRYTSSDWRTYREHCANVLIAHRNGATVDLSRDFPVLGFFENIGHLVRRGALDKIMIWNKFGWYVVRYHLALTRGRSLIEENRRSEADPTLWEEFEWLNRQMVRIYKRKGVAIDRHDLVAARIEELIQQESNAARLAIPQEAFTPLPEHAVEVIAAGTGPDDERIRDIDGPDPDSVEHVAVKLPLDGE